MDDNDEEINKCIVFHVFDNLPFVKEKNYRVKASCEFCKASHANARTCDMKVGDVSVNSSEGCRNIRYRDVLSRIEHNRELTVGVIFRENTKAEWKYLIPVADEAQVKLMK